MHCFSRSFFAAISSRISIENHKQTLAILAAAVMLLSPQAHADSDDTLAGQLNDLAQIVHKQQSQIADMENKLNDRQQEIDDLQRRLNQKDKAAANTQPSAPANLIAPSYSQANPQMGTAKPGNDQAAASTDLPAEPVGEAPATNDKPPEIAAIANEGGVLIPEGKAIIEPFLEYSRSSVNSFTFEGAQIIPAFLIGDIAANRISRDLVTSGASVYAGITDRLELEAKVPFVWRQDSTTNTIPNISNNSQTETANGYGLGDVELAAHYQINDGHDDWPFFVGNLRFKTNTGTSPYEVAYNADGSARDLATGSGFMAVEPSLTVIYPIDPAVLFGNLGYIHSFSDDVNRNVAGNLIGNVSPGDTYIVSAGIGVALNDRLSFTLGYEQDYVRPTVTEIGGVNSRSDALQVGSALTGLSFKVNDRVHINLNLAAGVTRDAPDTQVTLRVPVEFDF